MTSGPRIAVILVAGVLLSGAMWLVFGLADGWFRGEVPQAAWWQYLAAIPIIGAVALTLEGIAGIIGRAFGFDQPNAPRWKKYLGIVTIAAFAISALVVYNLVVK